MNKRRHTIARIGAGLPGVWRTAHLDAGALTASAWPVPVYGEDSKIVGRGLGLVTTSDGRVQVIAESFGDQAAALKLRPQVTDADLTVRDGDVTITRAVFASLIAAIAPTATATDNTNPADAGTGPDQATQDNADTFTITENVTVNLDLPIADVDTPWDETAAVQRVAAQAGSDTTALGDAFLYQHPDSTGDTPEDYQFPVADVIDGELSIVPRAVAETAKTIDAGGDAVSGISAEDLQSISDVLDELMAKVAASTQESADMGPEVPGGTSDTTGMCEGCDGQLSADAALVATTTELPIAPDSTTWNGSQAESRVLAWATENGTVNARKLSQAYLVRDPNGDPQRQSSYRLPVADVINGQLQIVPAAVRAALASLGGARGGIQGLSAQQRQAATNAANRLMGRIRSQRQGSSNGGGQPTVPASGRSSTAAAASKTVTSFAQYKRHLNPPDSFFAPLQLDGPTPITVTAAGEVYGHVADWHECHAAFAAAGVCVTPPHSNCEYCRYHNGVVVTASGEQIRTGAYCVGGGHAPVDGPGSDIAAATSHYDQVAAVPARGVMREDDWGPYFHGALTPGATDEQIYAMLAFPPSGDWRPPTPGAPIEMVAVTAVNTEGFAVRNSITASAEGDVSAAILTHSSPYVAGRSTDRQKTGILDPELAALRREAVEVLAASIGRTRQDEVEALSAAVHR